MYKRYRMLINLCLAPLLAATLRLCHIDGAAAADNPTITKIRINYDGSATVSVMERMLVDAKPITLKDFGDGSDEKPFSLNDDASEPEDNERPLSLNDVLVSVLENNHDIKISMHRPDQARAAIMESRAVYDPEAFADWQHSRDQNNATSFLGGSYKTLNRTDTERLGVRQHTPTGGDVSVYREWNQGAEKYSNGSTSQHGHGGAVAVEVTQPLLNGLMDKENRTVIEISRLQLDISSEEVRLTVMQSIADSFEAYWNAALVNEEIRIYEETLEMAETLLKREQQRRKEGISTPLDVHRASEAVATRTANLYYAREQRQTAQEQLKLLMNMRGAEAGCSAVVIPTDAIETPPIETNIEKSIVAALTNRPEMRSADLAIRTSEARRGYARHNLLPRLDVVGSVRRNDLGSNTPSSSSTNGLMGNDWTLGVQFSMPIGNMKARAIAQRAESELSQAIDEKGGMRSRVMAEVKVAVKTLDLVAREIPVSKKAAEAAKKVVEGEWARFEINQVSNRDLLQAQDLLAVAERNRIQTQIRYNVALARLLEAEGTLLDHLGVKLNP